MKRLLSYYGDDFTGSTDVMEALASHGVPTVLFTRQPTTDEFAPFTDYQVVGLAGTSRSETPEWMDQNLPQLMGWLKTLDAQYCHYKVCSTFDSAVGVGNIGRATEIGARLFGQAMVPLIVGAPQLKRYTFSGHLFAGFQGEVYRIDRHPVMSRHPVTPMDEADLRIHLARQTSLPISLANVTWPERGVGLLDVFDASTQLVTGRRLLERHGGFVVGSSGVEYALLAALGRERIAFPALEAKSQIIVVSGSVSPTTERQIKFASQNGFEAVPVDAVAMARWDASAIASAIERGAEVLARRRSPLVHTALGPSSDVGEQVSAVPDGRKNIGVGLGRILRALVGRSGIRRVIVAGGDSSSHALGQLGIHALTTRMPLPKTPGSPLCIAHSSDSGLSGLEIALKGGQVGGDDYFSALRDGKNS